jgi:hypothetical protein
METCTGHANGFDHFDIASEDLMFDWDVGVKVLLMEPVAVDGTTKDPVGHPPPYLQVDYSILRSPQGHRFSLRYAMSRDRWKNEAAHSAEDVDTLIATTEPQLARALKAIESGGSHPLPEDDDPTWI